MLPGKYKLKHMKDFEILFAEGDFVVDKLVTAKVWQVDPCKYSRRKYTEEDLKIGFIVGKKVHKGAVKRNRLKRQMREVVRLLLKGGRLKSGYMIAIMAKGNALGKDYKEIEASVKSLLGKARVLKNKD